MIKYPDTKIAIEGHTDSIGSNEYNQKLSERRANSVKNYIIDNFGIDAKRLRAEGFGETRPIADNNTDEGRQRNRRVESVLIKLDKN
jgi:OOP family OmpA-OmpF porin